VTRVVAWAARHPWRWLGLYLVVTAALYQLAIRAPWWEGWPIHPSALDQAIPLLPWTAWLYVTYFLLMPSWVFLTRHHPEAGRLRVVAGLCVVGNLLLNLAFPTYIADPLTPDLAAERGWLLGVIVSSDRPYAAVPSGHLSLPVALLTLALARRLGHRWLYLPWVLAMGLSILTTRQHYLVDAVGGLVWGLLGPALAWRLTRPGAQAPAARAP
jgi:membrane-associated phospholipid phosphatase